MAKTVIGLFDRRDQAMAVAAQAGGFQIDEQHIKVLDGASPSSELVEPSPRPRMLKGVRSFTILGTLIFAVFGAFAAVGSVVSTDAPVSFAVQIYAVFLAIGLFSGVTMGYVKGRSDAEQEIQAFRESFAQGSAMLVVESDAHADGIAEEMRRQGGRMVFVSEHTRPMPVPPAEDLRASPVR